VTYASLLEFSAKYGYTRATGRQQHAVVLLPEEYVPEAAAAMEDVIVELSQVAGLANCQSRDSSSP